MAKNSKKQLKYAFGRVSLKICSLIIRILPLRLVYAIAKFMGYLGYRIAGKQRKIALESLSYAFGNQKSVKERKHIAQECFINMAKGALELLYLMDKTSRVKKRVFIRGKENLDQALAKGKGIIALTAHFGNFPLMLIRLAQEGYQVSGIMKPMHDEKIENYFYNRRIKMGIKTIYSQPRKECVDNTIVNLRKNELVLIQVDQNFGAHGGIYVDFFGTKAATATGPVVFALRTKASIVPMFIKRNNDDTQDIIIEPAIDIKELDNQEETLLRNTQTFTEITERYIKLYPAEWGWIHKRWKSKQEMPQIKNLQGVR